MRIKVYSFASDNDDGTQVFTFATREERAAHMLNNHVAGWLESHFSYLGEDDEPLVPPVPSDATADQIEEAFFECLNNSLNGECETFAIEDFIIENPEIVKETDS